MELGQLITPQIVIPNLRVTSKKQALQKIANRAAEISGRAECDIFEAFTQRDRLGAAGIGHGVGIPVGNLAKLDRLYLIFVRLETPIDFGAIDDQPVDLICAVLASDTASSENLMILARVSRLLQDQTICEKLRGSDSADAICAILTEPSISNSSNQTGLSWSHGE